MVLADLRRPRFARSAAGAAESGARVAWPAAALLYDLALIAAGSLLIALSAQVAIPLPFSPVPVTGQTFGVLFVASMLGRARGTAAVLAYLAEGAAGLPVFAGLAAGPAKLLGPTGGYLLGFVPGAWLCGALAERGWDRTPLRATASMILGNIAIFALGLPWLARFVGASNVWALGFWPFLPGDIVKIGLAAALLPLGWKALGARGR
ncbi:MAG TPA: biotin transporter BioY [Acidobacteriota bacterium]|nr:biotin transporter BioY [Acidobacteriota bacterium]